MVGRSHKGAINNEDAEGSTVSERTVSELISSLNSEFRKAAFTRVEEELVCREEKLKKEIEEKIEETRLLQEKLYMEGLEKLKLQKEFGLSQFAAVKEEQTLVDSLKSAVRNAEAVVSRAEKLKMEIEGKNREIQLLQEKLSEKSRSEKELKELASRIKEERDGLSARLKENEAVMKENFELKRKNCDLECAKLRAETDVDFYRSRLKEFEGRVLNLEKDVEMLSKAKNTSEPVDVEIGNETSAEKRKESENFVNCEELSGTNANPTGGSSLGKRTDDIVVIIDSDDECLSHESASELEKAHSGQNVAENEPGVHERISTPLTKRSRKSTVLDDESPDTDDDFQPAKSKQAKVEGKTPSASLGEHHLRTTQSFEPSRRSVWAQKLLDDDSSSSSSSDNDPFADFSTFIRTEDFIYTTPKMRSS